MCQKPYGELKPNHFRSFPEFPNIEFIKPEMITIRKLGLYGMIAAVHGIMIWFYQIPFPNPANMPQPILTSPVIMAAGTDWDATLQKHPLTRDPLLLARAHEKGFTGGLWNKSFKSPNPYNDWEEAPRYLGIPELKWGGALIEYLDRESQGLWKPLSKQTGKLESTGAQTKDLIRASRFRFSSNLRGRSPENLPELPLWNGTQPLATSRMQVGIHPLGAIQSIRLLDPQEPDSVHRDFLRQAIRITKQLKFQPLSNSLPTDPSSTQWGEVEIQWEQASPDVDQKPNLDEKGEIR